MTAYVNHTDRQLFSLIAKGDLEAFETFFFRYNVKVCSFTHHIVKNQEEAEELTQDVFLKIWLNRTTLNDIKDPGNYLFVIAKNHSLDKLERNNILRKGESNLSGILTEISNETDEGIVYRESSQLVYTAVQQLPAQQQVVYRLSKEEGLSRDEIAERLKISPHTVKNHLGVAITAIRQYLHKYNKFARFLLSLHGVSSILSCL